VRVGLPLRFLNRQDGAILLSAWAWLGATGWMRPLMLPDEGRYVGVAWEMLQSGQWLTPTLDGLPFFHKPPLFYWITAAALAVGEPGEWAARLAPLLGAGIGATALYVFTVRWAGRELARRALLALLAQPLFYLGGQFANLDMLVAGCITATVLLMAHAALCLETGQPWRPALMAGHAMAALGVLAKGLIGVVLPALVLLAWLAATRRLRLLPRLLSVPGLALLALIAVPWFVVMQQRYPGFLDYFFVVQHVKRFAEGGFNNVQPAWFYPALMLLVFLPWLPWLWRPGSPAGAAPSLRWLMLLWAGVVVAFFSLPHSKLVGYVLPAVPPLAWLAADGLHASGWRPRAWLAVTLVIASIGPGIAIGLALHPVRTNEPLGRSLRAVHRAGEPVVMLGAYLYDLPFHARLAEPAVVVDDWGSPGFAQRDDWRKELADAARFAPAQAARQLVRPEALDATLCAAPVSWVIGRADQAAGRPLLGGSAVIAESGGLRMWRVATACSRIPTAGSAGR